MTYAILTLSTDSEYYWLLTEVERIFKEKPSATLLTDLGEDPTLLDGPLCKDGYGEVRLLLPLEEGPILDSIKAYLGISTSNKSSPYLYPSIEEYVAAKERQLSKGDPEFYFDRFLCWLEYAVKQ